MGDPVLPHLQFYVPRNSDFRDIPRRDEDVWSWVCDHPATPSGRTVWTIYTCLILQKRGFDCSIVREFPRTGIVVSHRDFLPATLRPRPNVYLVCLKPDRKRHSWAHVHVVQNSSDPMASQSGRRGNAPHVPYWPQPSLIPRNPDRGSRVEQVAYIGRALNLEPQLRCPQWGQNLKNQGVQWQIVPLRRWHDYSQVDVTVSIRRFGDAHVVAAPTMSSETKPPSKLTNSWLAGVPAIVGDESSFRAIQKSKLDFMIANSESELVEAINRLGNDPALYTNMVEHGRLRSQEFSVESVATSWERVFFDDIAPRYRDWDELPVLTRGLDNWRSYLQYWIDAENISSAARAVLRQ
jgi:hypothetical protein